MFLRPYRQLTNTVANIHSHGDYKFPEDNYYILLIFLVLVPMNRVSIQLKYLLNGFIVHNKSVRLFFKKDSTL